MQKNTLPVGAIVGNNTSAVDNIIYLILSLTISLPFIPHHKNKIYWLELLYWYIAWWKCLLLKILDNVVISVVNGLNISIVQTVII